MILRSKQLSWVVFEHLSAFPELIHFSTTRLGGVSAHPQASLNMGFVETDSIQNVINNRCRMANVYGINPNNMVFSRQTHSANIHFVTSNDKGKGVYVKLDAISDNDAYILTEPEICACILTADCVPLFLYDPVKKIAGLAHSGWRGTVKHISFKLVEQLIQIGCHSKDIFVGMGPSIKACCYTVKEDVFQAFYRSYGHVANHFFEVQSHQLKLNLNEAIIYDLLQAGIPLKNIEMSKWCTFCNTHLFFSARNSNKGMTGRMLSGIMIKGK